MFQLQQVSYRVPERELLSDITLDFHANRIYGLIGHNGSGKSTRAAAALAAVLWLSARRDMLPLTVVLAGLVMSLYLGAVSAALTLFYSEETRGIMLWGSGSLVQDGWHDVCQLLWRGAAAAAAVWLLGKSLSLMTLGDAQAAAAGVNVARIRLAALTAAAWLSANVVALVGMMGFVGLAAATLVRQAGVRTPAARRWLAVPCGAMLLLVTDNILVLLKHFRGTELPAGAVTAVAGAPLLLWLMTRTPARPLLQAAAPAGTAPAAASPWLRRLPALLAAAVLLALFVGRGDNGWQWQADGFLLSLRYPRLLTAVAAGVMLAVAGVLLQRLTQNPMASPEILGIGSGTAVGAMAAVLLWNVPIGEGAFWLAGGGGALFTLCLILLLNRRNGLMPEKVLLTGVAVAALADSALRLWAAGGDFRIQQLLVWLSGSTYHSTPAQAWTVFALAAAAWAAVLPLSRWLGLLGLGGTVAQAAGVNVAAARVVLVLAAAALTAGATLLTGPLSFVGLLAPHLAQMLGARTPQRQLAAAACIGATVMAAADWLGRQALFPYELPAGLTATLLGGAYLLAVLRRL